MSVPRLLGKASVKYAQTPEELKPLFDYRERGNQPHTRMMHTILPGFVKDPVSGLLPKWNLNPAEEEAVHRLLEDEDVCDYYRCQTRAIAKTHTVIVYNRKKTRNYFYQVCLLDGGGGYIMKSMEYGGHQNALDLLRTNKVTWMLTFPLTSLTLVFPRRGTEPSS